MAMVSSIVITSFPRGVAPGGGVRRAGGRLTDRRTSEEGPETVREAMDRARMWLAVRFEDRLTRSERDAIVRTMFARARRAVEGDDEKR